MCNWHNDSTDELCEAILSLKNRDECYAFLEDICTIKELLEMSQRLSVAKLLSRGMSYSQISQKTGVSTATISRISRCIEYGSGGYKMIIERLQEGEKND
jgi:TrpR-related protein YerC/YecD